MNGAMLGAIVIFILNSLFKNIYCETMDQVIANAAKSVRSFDFLSDAGDGSSMGKVTVELDMVFTTKDWEEIQKRNSTDYCKNRSKRKATRKMEKRWPQATLVYEIIERDFTPEDRQSIQNAMDRWSRHTCVRFRPAKPKDKNKIRIEDGSMCSSLIGMQQGLQKVTLAYGCRREGTIIHELGHALGFYHEHSRPDRDDYITVNKRNIHDAVFYNFNKYTTSVINTYNVRYDYLSIMHYGPKYFAKDYRSYSIVTRDAKYQDKIGNRESLSFGDIKLANLMYDCKGMYKCPVKRCPGEGYVGKDCKCWCRGDPVRLCDSTIDKQTTTPAPTSKPSPRTTKRTVTDKTEHRTSCSDKLDGCRAWSARGDCKHTRLMWQFCPKACGKCDSGKDVATVPCEDDYDLCRRYSAKGYCKHVAFRRYMEAYCRKSCDTCGRSRAVTSTDYDMCDDNSADKLKSHYPFVISFAVCCISTFILHYQRY